MKLEKQDFIGEATSVLSTIVHKTSATVLDLKIDDKQRGKITVKCEELSEANGIVKGCFKGIDIKKKCFYQLYNVDEKNGLTSMYKSEVKANGDWKEFEMNSILFCNGDLVSILWFYSDLNSIVLLSLKYLNIRRMVVILRLVRLKYYDLFISFIH